MLSYMLSVYFCKYFINFDLILVYLLFCVHMIDSVLERVIFSVTHAHGVFFLFSCFIFFSSVYSCHILKGT